MKISQIEAKLINHCGDDLSVVNAARVSFEKESEWDIEPELVEQVLNPKDAKLIAYLAKHKHFSPFNHAFLSFRVKAPIFVARQLVKHKFMPWNEVSRRYVDSEPEFFIPEGFRAKAENVKQGSADGFVEDVAYSEWSMAVTPKEAVEDTCRHSLVTYFDMIESGVCPEMARMVLPLNTMTEWIWSGTLGAFGDMLKLRLDPHTQYESRIVAEQIYEQIEPLFPVSIKVLLENK